jgi:myo-inositol 2-dehydrogenase/D-chiro-inositol 1-dehydrogenase
VSEPFRIGFLGAGHISQTHARALAGVPGGRLVGVWSRTRESAERFAARHGLELATTDAEALVDAVDVVAVNSINALHAEHVILAARAGRHVVVEKPLAVSLEQGRAMLAACAEAGVGLGYAEELCFVPKFVRARDVVRSGELGEVVHVWQRESHGGPYSPWFFTRDEAGGGVLMDMACHSVELVRWLLDKPAVLEVTAEIRSTGALHRTELDDHSLTHLRFEGGATALCEASWVLQGGMQSRLEVWGTRGHLAVDLLGETGVRLFAPDGSGAAGTGRGWASALVDPLGENGYPQEWAEFLRCFRSGERPEESGEDGLAVLEILCAAYASSARGSRVALPFRGEPVERAVDLWLARG